MRPWLILGCGYTGTRLAQALIAAGRDVTVTRRGPGTVAEIANQLGVRGLAADLSDAAAVDRAVRPDAIVVCLAPPGDDPASEARALIAGCHRAARIVYVGSTGVYAPGGGAWVDEAWPIAPTTRSGHKRQVVERVLAEATSPHVVLRVAGIHGPGRGLVDRIRAGDYRVVGDGTAHVSRIHVDDLVRSIVDIGDLDVTGPINVADDDPAPIGQVADAISDHFGVPRPRRIDPSAVSPEVSGMLLANRRIDNRRLRGLGIELAVPSWRSLIETP